MKLIINFTLGNYSEVSSVSFIYTMLLGSLYFSSSPTQGPKPFINLHVKNCIFWSFESSGMWCLIDGRVIPDTVKDFMAELILKMKGKWSYEKSQNPLPKTERHFCLFIHSFIHSYTHPFTYLFIYLFIHSLRSMLKTGP